MAQSRQWKNFETTGDFLLIFGALLLIIIGFNFMIGLYLARKITRPLEAVSSALDEIKKGKLTTTVQIKPGDSLGDFVTRFNQATHSVFHVITRDHDFIVQARDALSRCRSQMESRQSLSETDKQEAEKQIFKAESLISFVNEHFLLKKED